MRAVSRATWTSGEPVSPSWVSCSVITAVLASLLSGTAGTTSFSTSTPQFSTNWDKNQSFRYNLRRAHERILLSHRACQEENQQREKPFRRAAAGRRRARAHWGGPASRRSLLPAISGRQIAKRVETFLRRGDTFRARAPSSWVRESIQTWPLSKTIARARTRSGWSRAYRRERPRP